MTRLLLLPGLCALALMGCGKQETSVDEAPTLAVSSAPEALSPEQITTQTGVTMVRVPAGEFTMGDDRGEDDAKPAHRVKVSAFYMDTTEVTQASYQALMGRNPAKRKGPDRPVEQVGWLAAVKYCNMRSRREGTQPCYDLKTLECDFAADGYRLPTEAEWEYACRLGGEMASIDERKLTKCAWFKANAGKTTHPVAQKDPSPWGLYDVQGNVWEWCHDRYGEGYYAQSESTDPRGPSDGDERVLRGGSWASGPESCQPTARYSETPGFADVCFGYDAYGFRCVRRATGPKPAE